LIVAGGCTPLAFSSGIAAAIPPHPSSRQRVRAGQPSAAFLLLRRFARWISPSPRIGFIAAEPARVFQRRIRTG